MFIMDVPYVPSHEAPIVLVQAAAPGEGNATQQPDFILKACQETQPTPDEPRSALRGVDPAGWLALELGKKINRDLLNDPIAMANIKPTLLGSTKHGKITAEVDNLGLTSYRYDPEAGYIGDDKATFMVEFEGKRYKVIVDIKVLEVVDFNSPQCLPPRLIKVTKSSAEAANLRVRSTLVLLSTTC